MAYCKFKQSRKEALQSLTINAPSGVSSYARLMLNSCLYLSKQYYLLSQRDAKIQHRETACYPREFFAEDRGKYQP